MIIVDRSRLGELLHDRSTRMAAGYAIITIFLVITASVRDGMQYLFIIAAVSAVLTGLMIYVTVMNTDVIVQIDDDDDDVNFDTDDETDEPTA